jgi:hypothetical protein
MASERSFRLSRGIGILVTGCLLVSACGFAAWRDRTYQQLMDGTLHLDASQIAPRGGGSQTVEFCDRGGQHVGYGRVSGGTIELYDSGSRHIGYGVIGSGSVNFYNADGSRAGYGRIGR